jgi:general stress protein 26
MAPETIEKLIDKVPFALLGSVDEDGFPNVKAMLPPRRREGLETFWFTTNTSSLRVAQFRREPRGCAYFADGRFFRGVMFVGHVEVLEDAASKELIWREGDDLYYPKGVTDPDYCVLLLRAFKYREYQNFRSHTAFLANCADRIARP